MHRHSMELAVDSSISSLLRRIVWLALLFFLFLSPLLSFSFLPHPRSSNGEGAEQVVI